MFIESVKNDERRKSSTKTNKGKSKQYVKLKKINNGGVELKLYDAKITFYKMGKDYTC